MQPPHVTYGITPPKVDFDTERRERLAAAQTERIKALPVDAVVVYDLQDESSRTKVERPFPFTRCVDPLRYAFDDLAEVPQPRIVYRSTADTDGAQLEDWLRRLKEHGGSTVLVGAPSDGQHVQISLRDAYALRRACARNVPLGGVAIAERHEKRGDEHERMLTKMDEGCSFFITQAVFSVTGVKNLLSDLYYACEKAQRTPPPLLITLSPCGSLKTLAFLRWLGVHVPRWIENELTHARNILERSVDLVYENYEQLSDFAQKMGIELGCNIESVSTRKAEIEASVELVHRVATGIAR